jgi:hypothetical protein
MVGIPAAGAPVGGIPHNGRGGGRFSASLGVE